MKKTWTLLRAAGAAFLRGWAWWDERHRGWRPITTVLAVVQFACVCWWLATMPEPNATLRWLFRGSYATYIWLGFIQAPRSLREWKCRKRNGVAR